MYLPAEEVVCLASSFHTVSVFSVLLYCLSAAKVFVRRMISFLSSSQDLDSRGLRAVPYTAELLSASHSEQSSAAVYVQYGSMPRFPLSRPTATDWTAARRTTLLPGFMTASESTGKTPSVILTRNSKGRNARGSAFTPYSHGQFLLCSSQRNTH